MDRQTVPTHAGENPLGYAPLGGLIARFAIPTIISMLVTAAYNVTDQAFIGNVVGLLGTSATGVTFPLVLLTMAFIQLGVGTAANFNLSMGEGKEEDAKHYIGTGLTMVVTIGVLLSAVLLLFKMPVLRLCGATDTALPYASMYLGITAFGIPFQIFSSGSTHLIRADGSPSYAMLCNVFGAVLNIFLDWLFMVPLQWGIRGAALATVIGQIVAALLCLWYYARRFKTFSIRRNMLGLRPFYVLRIFKLGLSAMLNQFLMMVANITLNNVLRHYGALSVYGSDIPLAFSGVMSRIHTILTALTVGISLGCQPIWGYNMGAKNIARLKKAHKIALVTALCISCAAFLLFQFFPRQIAGLFGSGDELYFQFAEKYLRVYLMMVFVFGVQPMAVDFFTAIGNAKQGILLSMSRQGLFLVPLLLLLPRQFGLNGVLMAGPIADFLAFSLAVILLVRSYRKMGQAPRNDQSS